MKFGILVALFLSFLGFQSAFASCNLEGKKLQGIGQAKFEKGSYSAKTFSAVCKQIVNMGDDNEKDCYIGFNSPPYSTHARNIKLISSRFSVVKWYYQSHKKSGIDLYIGNDGRYYTRADSLFCRSANKVKLEFK